MQVQAVANDVGVGGGARPVGRGETRRQRCPIRVAPRFRFLDSI